MYNISRPLSVSPVLTAQPRYDLWWLFRTVWQDSGWFEAQPRCSSRLFLYFAFFLPTYDFGQLTEPTHRQPTLSPLSGTYCRQLYRFCRRRGGESIFSTSCPEEVPTISLIFDGSLTLKGRESPDICGQHFKLAILIWKTAFFRRIVLGRRRLLRPNFND